MGFSEKSTIWSENIVFFCPPVAPTEKCEYFVCFCLANQGKYVVFLSGHKDPTETTIFYVFFVAALKNKN